MKKDKVLIACIVDRSGSMSSIWSECVDGLNNFIDEQRKQSGETVFDLIVFDDAYTPVYVDVNIEKVKPFDGNKYSPRGMTALYDAVGRTMRRIGERLYGLREEERPEQVIICILTDGHENASKEYTKDILKDQIKLQQDTYNWKFVFLAANQDAMLSGSEMGINSTYTSNYAATKSGIRDAYHTMSASISNIRSSSKD